MLVGTSEHHQSRPENQKAFASDRCAPWGPFKRSIVQLQIQRLPPQIPPSPYFSKGHSNKNPTGSTEDVKGSLKSVRTNQTSRHARPNRFPIELKPWFVTSTNPCQGPSQPSGFGEEHHATSWRGGEGGSPTWIQGGKKRTNWKRHWSRAKGFFPTSLIIIVWGSCFSAHTTLSHQTLSHATLSHTRTPLALIHNPSTHNFVTLNSFTRNSVTHSSFTHNSSTNNSVTHTHKSFPRNSFTQLFHIQRFPTQLFHTQLYHTYTHTFVTHNSLTHTTLSHATLPQTALSHTNCPTQLFHIQHFHTPHFRIRLLHTTGPPPSPLLFLPFPSHFHICLALWEEVDMWCYPVLWSIV